VDALTRLVRRLPEHLPLSICVVVHVPAGGRSLLASILDRRTRLRVLEAQDGAPIEAGVIYVAPNDRHLMVDDGRLRLDRGPKINGARPAVDPMLRSLAAAYGPRAVAVILSGALGDGAGGVLAVRRAGGTVIVQDPDDATVPSMPSSALRAIGRADAVLDAAAIGPALQALLPQSPMREDATVARDDHEYGESPDRPGGPPSPYTCPECNGALWEIKDGVAVRYTCRVGHSYSEDALVVEQGSAVESALWAALEALEERAELLQRVAARHAEGRPQLRDRFNGAADDALQRAELIREALGTSGEPHALSADVEPAG
jgi:two-component system chemotaxis response regulator CheB